jgi:hydroxymethylpyrimidine pyrophosphatase-like HAD family hydrolase
MSKRVPVAVITTKDMTFMSDKVPFAHGLAAVSGAEILTGQKRFVDERFPANSKTVETAYRKALSKIIDIDPNISIERKTTEKEDILIAFCIDWRLAKNRVQARENVRPLLASCRELGLYVVESETGPFADIYAATIDKGMALQKLRSELGINGSILYLGDSERDNPAFELAEVSVGVKHQKTMPHMSCKYILEFLEVEVFIASLLDADLEFKPEMVIENPKTN